MMRNSGGWDGTLSPDDFHSAARFLSDRWNQIRPTLPQWKWIPCGETPIGASCNVQTEGYLSLESMYHLNCSEEHLVAQSASDNEDPFDSATLILRDNDETHIYDFHIVYSFSYMVPVLYFRGYQCGGQPLDLDDIRKDLPCYSLSILRESKWTFMTMEEHPYLHRPWYTLHPCGTSDWMKLLLGGIPPGECPKMVHYLPAWLSVVGQAVGLKIPLELQNMSLQDGSSSAVSV